MAVSIEQLRRPTRLQSILAPVRNVLRGHQHGANAHVRPLPGELKHAEPWLLEDIGLETIKSGRTTRARLTRQTGPVSR